jgi:hypothetical protein
MAYSDADKAMAVEIVRRKNGVIDTVCLSDIQTAIGKHVTSPSVRLWVKQFAGEVSEEKKKNFTEKKVKELQAIQQVVAKKLDEKLEAAAHKFVDHATNDTVVNVMTGQQAMTAAAIAIDKMRLLRDLPTEIIGAIPVMIKIADLFKELEWDAATTLEDYYQQLHAMAQAKKQQSEVLQNASND